MRAIDTNVLVRSIVRDHDKQAEAADAFIAGDVWVSQIVLLEAAWVLSSVYGLSRAALAIAIGRILNHVSIVVQDADVAETALESFKSNTKVQFADCLMLATARKAGCLPLGTFDTALSKMDGAELVK